ncbi:Golgi transport complex subunit 4 [Saitoella coloradoensis]
MTPIDPPSIHTATSLLQIQSALDALSTRNASLTAALDLHLANRAVLDTELRALSTHRARLIEAGETAGRLGEVVGKAGRGAESVGARVRNLDLEGQRVRETREVVIATQDLKDAIQELTAALEAPVPDYTRAISASERALAHPRSVLESPFAAAVVPSEAAPLLPHETIANAGEKLVGVVEREFWAAVKTGDSAAAEKWIRIFSRIGKPDIGVSVYQKFIVDLTVQKLKSITISTTDPSTYPTTFGTLLSILAKLLTTHTPIIASTFDTHSALEIAQKLQNEGDRRGALILNSHWEERGVERAIVRARGWGWERLTEAFTGMEKKRGLGVSVAQNALKGSLSAAVSRVASPAPGTGVRRSLDARDREGGSVEDVLGAEDVRELDLLSVELGTFLARWNAYTGYVQQKVEIDGISTVLAESALEKKVTERVLGVYVELTTHLLRRNLEKAFVMEEKLEQITSVVDDLFYITKSLLSRTLATGDVRAIRGVASGFRRILESDFLGIARRRVSSGAVTERCVWVNNLHTARIYLARVIDELTGRALSPEDVKEVLEELGGGVKGRIEGVCGEGVRGLFGGFIRGGLRGVVENAFAGVDYTSSSTGPSNVGTRFSKAYGSLLAPLSTTILPPLLTTLLLTHVLPHLSSLLTQHILTLPIRGEINLINLERDARAIVAIATEHVGWEGRALLRGVLEVVEGFGEGVEEGGEGEDGGRG